MPANFFDTNTLVYLMSADVEKASRAEELVAQGGVISVQVLNELANVGRRKMRLEWAELHLILGALHDLLEVQALTVETHQTGLKLSERYKLSIYDAMIVASALEAGCDTLWSEDMHHGLVVHDRLHIANPFR